MEDPVSHEEKTRWFAELLQVQEKVAARRCLAMVGTEERVLIEDRSEKSGLLSGRTGSSHVVEFAGSDELIGQFARVRITEAKSFLLRGELIP